LLPRFPAQVLAGTGISITKNGGTYVFATTAIVGLPLSSLAPIPESTLIGRGSGTGTGVPVTLTASGGLVFGGSSIQMSSNQKTRSLNATFLTPVANATQDFSIPVSCTIKQVTLLSDVVGNAVVDIRKISFASFPSGAASICASTKPALSATQKFRDVDLTGWTTAVGTGDILRVFVESVSTITRLSVGIDAETI
jgi:hypothetical protein